jgi:hypothetical protein
MSLIRKENNCRKKRKENRPMEKLKTQEAAFPTFPQGPPPEKKTGTRREPKAKEALSRAHHSQPDLTVQNQADRGGIFSLSAIFANRRNLNRRRSW